MKNIMNMKCPCCQGGEPLYAEPYRGVRVFLDGDVLRIVRRYSGKDISVKIDYCPRCGAKLGGKET